MPDCFYYAFTGDVQCRLGLQRRQIENLDSSFTLKSAATWTWKHEEEEEEEDEDEDEAKKKKKKGKKKEIFIGDFLGWSASRNQ